MPLEKINTKIIKSENFAIFAIIFALLISTIMLGYSYANLTTSFAANDISVDNEVLKNSTPSDKIHVYFNKDVDTSYKSNNARKANGKADLEKIIINRIKNSKNTIDLAVMYLEDKNIIQALKDAEKEGIQVRIIVDYDRFKEVEEAFRGSNIEIKENNKGRIQEGKGTQKSIMHYKFGLFDQDSKENAYLITSSANWKEDDFYVDSNNLVSIQDQALVKAYLDEFEQMWSGNFNRSKDLTKHRGEIFNIDGRIVELWMAPYADPFASFSSRYVNLFKEAKKSVYFATFNFTITQLSRVLEEKFNEGLDIRGISNEGIWDIPGSVYMDMRGLSHRTKYTPWNKIAYENIRHDAIDGDKSALHYKYFIIDGNIAITGACNPTISAVFTNDEDALIIHDPLIANEFEQNFFAHFRKYGGQTKDSIIKIVGFNSNKDSITVKNLTENDINLNNWRIEAVDDVYSTNIYFPKNKHEIIDKTIVKANDELEVNLPSNFLPNDDLNDKFLVKNSEDNGEIYLFDDHDLLQFMIWY